MKLVLSSRNAHKIVEIKAVLSARGLSDIEVLSLDDIGYTGEIEETGTTFEENAVIKASVPASLGYCGLADDSGLSVDALDGAPGVYSARYAGEPCDDAANNKKLLEAMNDVPDGRRGAHYVSVIAFVDPQHPENNFTVRGECSGVILREGRGDNGFGYDPLFFLPTLNKTYAEITVEEKNAISHRGKSMGLFADRLAELHYHD